jgi:hypothetical protein
MNLPTIQHEPSIRSEWFDNLVATLRSHEVQLDTETADENLKKFYANFMSTNMDEIAAQNRALSQQYFVTQIAVMFWNLVKDWDLTRLAFDYSDSELLVWAEISDDQESLWRKLILAEAEVNAEYHKRGYDVNLMIVEESDQLNIPEHYQKLKDKN